MVTRRAYKSELQQAKDYLQELATELDELQVKIAKQKRVIAALSELTDLQEDSDAPWGLVTGITDACKTAILSAEKALLPMEVRDRIKALGFPDQENLLASVHTVLKRLAARGDAIEIPVSVEGRTQIAYRKPTLGERIGRAGKEGMNFK